MKNQWMRRNPYGRLRGMTDTTSNPLKGHVITVDGPSASGKGTLALRLAKHYRVKYLDTGTLYRAVVYQALQEGVDLADTPAVAAVGQAMEFDYRHTGNNVFATFLNGENVEAGIRTPEVERGIPLTAPEPLVRAALRGRQTDFAEQWKDVYGVVLDGRDCGAVIYPQATVKLFMVGDARQRAERRAAQYMAQGLDVDVETIHADLLRRDARDAPNTIQTPDAVVIDVTKLGIEEVLATAIEVIDKFTSVQQS